MTEPSRAITDLLKPQVNGLDQLVPVCENILKFFLWCTTFIPFINSWVDEGCKNLCHNAVTAPFNRNKLDQLGMDSFLPRYYPSKIIDKHTEKIVYAYCERIKRSDIPHFSVCHSTLGSFSNNEKCKTALKDAVYAFYQSETISHSPSLPLGKKGQKHPLPLSSEFLNACSEALPSRFKTAQTLDLNGPIANATGSEALRTLIQKMNQLTEIRFSSDLAKTGKNFFALITHLTLTPPIDETHAKLPSHLHIEKIGEEMHLKISTTHFDKYVNELSHAFTNLRAIHIESDIKTKNESEMLKKWIKTLKGSATVYLPPDFFESSSTFSTDFFKPMTTLKVMSPSEEANGNCPKIILDAKTNNPTLSIPSEKVTKCLEMAPTHFQHFKTLDLSDQPEQNFKQIPLKEVIDAIPSISQIYLPIDSFASSFELLKDRFLNEAKDLDCHITPLGDNRLKFPRILVQKNSQCAFIETPLELLPNYLTILAPYFETVSQLHFPPNFLKQALPLNSLVCYFRQSNGLPLITLPRNKKHHSF